MLAFVRRTIPIKVHLLGRWNFHRASEAKADPRRVGQIPYALGQLRVLLFPAGVRAHSPRGAELSSVAGPTSAADAARIQSLRPHERVCRTSAKPPEIIRD